MAIKSTVTEEAHAINLATGMIRFGARLQMLQAACPSLSKDKLIRLYKEVAGKSPSKGMLPFSTDWYIGWSSNIHSSMFIGIHRYLAQNARLTGFELLLKSFEIYHQDIQIHGEYPLLSITRAWYLVRFFESRMLSSAPCTRCGGHFVVHAHDLVGNYVCGICSPPSRAGKTGYGRGVGKREGMQQPAVGTAS